MRDRVRSKWEQEIAKDIAAIRNTASQATLTELLFLLTAMHNVRLELNAPDSEPGENSRVVRQIAAQHQEAIRYTVSMILKFGQLTLTTDESTGRFDLDHQLAVRLLNMAKVLNSKYEVGALVGLATPTPRGERDRYAELDFRDAAADPVARRLMTYFVRTELNGELARSKGKGLVAMVESYLERFRPFADLIPPVFGVEVEMIARFVLHVGQAFQGRIEAAMAAMGVHDENDIVPAWTDEWFQRYSRALVFPIAALREALGDGVMPLIDRLSFSSDAFDEQNLQVHLLWRRPIIRIKNVLVICPEFLLDSLSVNTHYSLLEAESVKDAYKAQAANSFVDRIATLAAQHGWSEQAREVFIRKGKKDLGDLDLVLQKNGEVMAIEAKNHVLPLAVYFHDVDATRLHLERSQREIEAKVQARIEYLGDHHGDYGLPPDFRYVVVTQSPEVLSHFSDLLVLSFDEFASWIARPPLLATFHEVHQHVYGHLPEMTMDDLNTLHAEGVLAFQFRPLVAEAPAAPGGRG